MRRSRPRSFLRVFGEVAIGVPYSEVRVRELLDANVRPLYEAKGRMRVAFPKLETEPAKGGVKGVILTVHVEEGPAYQFGTVGIARTVIPSDELLKIAGLKPKQPANFDAVTKAQEALKQRFRKSGYMEMTCTVERKIDDNDKKVDLVIRIEPGPQYRMGKLDVQGLDLFGEPAVKKLWALKEGSPYDENYPETFLTRIREEGYFDNLGKTRFEFAKALADPAVKAKADASGLFPATSTPAEFAAFIRKEAERWSTVVKETGMKYD